MKKSTYLLFIGLMFTLLGCGTSLTIKETPAPASSMLDTTSVPILSSKNQPRIFMDEFTQIKNGMTYEQVTEIIGAPGKLIAEKGTLGDQFYTKTYNFIGEGIWPNNSFAQLIFQNSKLNTKAQKGMLRPIKF